ncbi:LLM class flavin-dependent oxidoreductase [Microbacterium sp. ZW CA_36]|uniref:LLM class flavin-dependent oxidoreductase n=1 Tax=Microbacterium sp. ZW CA_36 TaxID=3378078 RepID=UPI003854446C
MESQPLEFGFNSFGDVPSQGGVLVGDAEAVRLLIDEARLAESVGLDIFRVGERYRTGLVDSATPVLLAAIATATTIKLGTAVTVLSTNASAVRNSASNHANLESRPRA